MANELEQTDKLDEAVKASHAKFVKDFDFSKRADEMANMLLEILAEEEPRQAGLDYIDFDITITVAHTTDYIPVKFNSGTRTITLNSLYRESGIETSAKLVKRTANIFKAMYQLDNLGYNDKDKELIMQFRPDYVQIMSELGKICTNILSQTQRKARISIHGNKLYFNITHVN